MSRLLGIKILGTQEKRNIYAFLKEQMKQIHPGTLNESLMDLGSVICRSDQPRCEVCPFKAYCTAYSDRAYPQYAWIKFEELDKFAFPKANHKLFDLLKNLEWK